MGRRKKQENVQNNVLCDDYIRQFVLPRKVESNKHDYGHLLLICGSETMPGAAALVTGAALKSGCGLVTLHSTRSVAFVTAMANPSAIYSISKGHFVKEVPDNLSKYSAIGIGPGLGTDDIVQKMFSKLLDSMIKTPDVKSAPMLLDADALNILAMRRDLIPYIPEGSVLTPHDGELERLTGRKWNTQEEKDDIVRDLCEETGCVVVAKGHQTRIYATDGNMYINPIGNAGMAKGGSGDVLSGLIAGLLARGYDAVTASMIGVWVHSFAGDYLSRICSMEAYNSRDLIDYLYCGFVKLR